MFSGPAPSNLHKPEQGLYLIRIERPKERNRGNRFFRKSCIFLTRNFLSKHCRYPPNMNPRSFVYPAVQTSGQYNIKAPCVTSRHGRGRFNAL